MRHFLPEAPVVLGIRPLFYQTYCFTLLNRTLPPRNRAPHHRNTTFCPQNMTLSLQNKTFSPRNTITLGNTSHFTPRTLLGTPQCHTYSHKSGLFSQIFQLSPKDVTYSPLNTSLFFKIRFFFPKYQLPH